MEDMKVTRDVITDLLPTYESGEASEDTKCLVREFLARDPEFGLLVERLKHTRLNEYRAVPPPELELKSLIRTKKLMRQQTSVMAVAIFFSLAPFAFTFEGTRINWLLIRDAPVVATTCLVTALALWIAYVVIRRKLKVL